MAEMAGKHWGLRFNAFEWKNSTPSFSGVFTGRKGMLIANVRALRQCESWLFKSPYAARSGIEKRRHRFRKATIIFFFYLENLSIIRKTGKRKIDETIDTSAFYKLVQL